MQAFIVTHCYIVVFCWRIERIFIGIFDIADHVTESEKRRINLSYDYLPEDKKCEAPDAQ